MQGRIIAAPSDDVSVDGRISGADGQRYEFASWDLQAGAARVGMDADFKIEGTRARDIYLIGAPGGARRTSRDWLTFLFSREGRVNRFDFWVFGMILPFVIQSILIRIGVLEFVFMFVGTWISFVISVKRFHDLGMSGRWALIPLVLGILTVLTWPMILTGEGRTFGTILSLWILSQLVVCYKLSAVGEPRTNRYGPPPL